MSDTKQEARHTPGPWHMQLLCADGVVIKTDGWEIMTPAYDICANLPHGAPIRKDADARLIALSPELLAELEGIAETLEKLAPCPEQVLDQIAERARTLCQKARGL